MDRLIEFIGHHPYLVSAFVALLIAFIITEMQRGGRSLSPQELSHLVNSQQARVIDLRNPPEYREGHITGSENLPYSQVAGKAAELAKAGKPLILVCALGQVSGMAAKTLKQAGAQHIYRLSGGISGWRQQGLPLIR
ncbi:MAG: rhodanese-like domain-containing protein [Perlucidibaca sp.]